MPPILITSFAPWRAHQRSNASDNLLTYMAQRQMLPGGAVLMRQIPVSFQLAPCQVIAQMVALQSPIVICCGMAESRHHLELELNAKRHDQVLQTDLNLSQLQQGTCLTRVSQCAGDYVCNHLYFELLAFISQRRWPSQALFIHIPPLTDHNCDWLAADMALILQRLGKLPPVLKPPLLTA